MKPIVTPRRLRPYDNDALREVVDAVAVLGGATPGDIADLFDYPLEDVVFAMGSMTTRGDLHRNRNGRYFALKTKE